jgi:prepilin-type N-terminal cleavage/methylation domain-containing protein
MHMTQAHDSRRPACVRDEHGFTLIEMLVSMLVATVITGAAFSFLIFTTEDVAHVTARVGVDQSGRVALQQMISELSSGCIAPNAQPIVSGSSASTLIFESEGGEQAAFPTVEKHEIIFTKGTSTTEGTLIEKAYVSTGTKEVAGKTTHEYSSTPTTKKLLLKGISQTKYGSEEATPIFRYYRYYHEGDSPPAGDATVPYGEVDSTPVANPSTEAANITKVTIAFTLAPEGKEVISFNHDRPVALEDSALFRLEPSSETPTVKNLPCEKPA